MNELVTNVNESLSVWLDASGYYVVDNFSQDQTDYFHSAGEAIDAAESIALR